MAVVAFYSKIAASVFVCLALFAFNASAQSKFNGKTMGPIEYNVVIYDDVTDKDTLQGGIQARLDQVNELMSTYIDSSDVSNVNAAPAERWVEVDPLTLHVVQRSIEINQLTDGAFDITVGPAVNRWKFGPDDQDARLPDDEEVERMTTFVGMKNIKLKSDPPAIWKSKKQTQIDLSAIAKGFAVDHVAAWLTDQSFENFMVEVGGEVFVRGEKPNGPWRLGIEKPQEIGRTVSGVVQLKNNALATSGDYRNFRIVDGKRLSHTIDPKTCRPVSQPPASCSVVSNDCMTADALATALMVMSESAGKKFCDENGIKANIVWRNEATGDSFRTAGLNDFPIAMRPDAMSSDVGPESKSIWPAFLGALIVFSLAIAGMAIGAIFNNKPITGSCGGISAMQNEDGSSSCSMCHKPVAECPDVETTEPEKV